jgi:hypothetical protein
MIQPNRFVPALPRNLMTASLSQFDGLRAARPLRNIQSDATPRMTVPANTLPKT